MKGFYPYVQELKNYVLRFKSINLENAQKQILSMFSGEQKNVPLLPRDSYNHKNVSYNKKYKKLVSIHVRLGDYEHHLRKLFNLPIIESNYFTRAMKYIVQIEPASNYIIRIESTIISS